MTCQRIGLIVLGGFAYSTLNNQPPQLPQSVLSASICLHFSSYHDYGSLRGQLRPVGGLLFWGGLLLLAEALVGWSTAAIDFELVSLDIVVRKRSVWIGGDLIDSRRAQDAVN